MKLKIVLTYGINVQKKIEYESLNELKDLINDMLDMLNSSIGKDINSITSVLSSYGKYDFRPTIEDANGDVEIVINKLGDIITSMLVENKKNGLILGNYSDKLISNVEVLNTSTNQQAVSLEETAASINEITSTIREASQNTKSMTKLAEDTKISASTGKALATKTAHAMEEINSSTTTIAEAITVIDQIAFQTNILSLNAAVEAATAGEAGKGFAVVAGEVRNLASRSAEAANEIKLLVTQAKEKANEGKSISSNMIEGYEELDSNIAQTAELISEVANTAGEQLSSMSQINDAISQLDTTTQENSKMASDTNNIAKDTDNIAKEIVTNVDTKEFNGKDTLDISTKRDKTTKVDENIINSKKLSKSTSTNTPSHNDDEWDTF